MKSVPRPIEWVFYPGAYGPSILVDLQDLDAVRQIAEIFERVAAGAVVRLEDEPRMRLSNMTTLEMTLSTTDAHKTLWRTRNGGFVWSCTTGQWRDHIDLLDPFLRGLRGHQYLTDESNDDALIEISFGERHG